MRVLFYMVICASFYLDFRIFKVRSLRSRGGEIPSFAPRDLACLDYQNIPALFNRSICSADAFIAPDTCPVLGDIPPSISRLALPPLTP